MAIAACLPYLALKVAWLSGSTVGIPTGSSLRGSLDDSAFYAVNVLTVAMDLTYAVQMLLGMLVLVAGAHLLAERAAAHGTTAASRRG
ncbi:hypothetical protein [Streptomyces sp. RKAG337]|uniref:hypothetical protein n=1 Tax=Streptomyces sp. RKAG337 TaxID=2893404 RepID=UPI0020338EA1|nr:hypothetical protein [Streptomyces sp. RKAG337]MCM2425311.1 hypothetical protein [Streptomyces sp. RKAG337]